MPSQPRSRGRLPARVYWFRRFMVLGTALALVFAFARLLDHKGPEKASARANTVAAAPSQTLGARVIGPQLPDPTAKATGKATARATAPAPVVLAEPDGPCAAKEVTVTPLGGTAAAGSTVPLVLQLTATRPACTFRVSPASLVAKVSNASGKVWSSQDCPSAVPSSTVVVRSAVPTTIQVNWSGRASHQGCSRSTSWALPGTFRVTAAAIGSEPSTGTLKLTAPKRPIVIKTIKPKPNKHQSTAPTTPDTGH